MYGTDIILKFTYIFTFYVKWVSLDVNRYTYFIYIYLYIHMTSKEEVSWKNKPNDFFPQTGMSVGLKKNG